MIKSTNHLEKENQMYLNDFGFYLICIDAAQNIGENVWSFWPAQAFLNN